MAKLDMAERKSLPSSDFALPGKGEGPSGKGAGSYPIPNKSHAINALARSANKSPEVKARVRAKVHARYPEIGKSEGKQPKLGGRKRGRKIESKKRE